MRCDPLIIGGGPAGSAAAITLARAGWRPVVVERTSGPTDKVCGDFLSADTVQQIKALGIDPLMLGAHSIDRIRLIIGEHVVETALPFAAVGLSRRALDAALLRQAEASGAGVQEGEAIRHLTRDGGQWIAQTGVRPALRAETVFLATGKHDLRDLPRGQTERGAVGMKTYFALAPGSAELLQGVIELTLFPGGYAGMQLVEGGRAVLCIAVRRDAFQRCGSGWPGLIAAIGHRSRRFASMLADARPLLPRPLAVAGIPYGYQARPASHDGLFRIGDQAAVIPSLTGDGMSIALHSGTNAAEIWLAGAGSTAYHCALACTLAPQMRLAGVLHCAGMSGLVQSALVHCAGLLPVLLRQAARHTRLRGA